MSFLGGVRWADLSSDTHSLSAAPPFCPGLDDDAVAPCPLGGGLSPHPTAFPGQASKKRGDKNVCDTAEALLMQCDAAAEQSYLNPSCAADLGCSNAGINLHFREAARLGCSTPVDEDMQETGDPIETYPGPENAGSASPRVEVDSSTVKSDIERDREQRVSNSARQQRGGQTNPIKNRQGRGFASGGASVSAGFKGLLASTNSVGGSSDGAALCNRKKWSRTANAYGTTIGTCNHVSSQHCAASQVRSLSREVSERTQSDRCVGISGSSARKSGCDNNRAGYRRGDAHRSTKAVSAPHKEQKKACGEGGDSAGGTQRYGEANGTGRPKDVPKGEHPSASGTDTGRSTEAQRDSGPDASDNWRSFRMREHADLPATELPEQAASCVCSPTTAPVLCTHEPQPERQLAPSGISEEDHGLFKRFPERPPVCFEVSARESRAQQQQLHASFEVPVREKLAPQQQQHSLVSSDAFMRGSRQKGERRASRLAARMMTPAKRHRLPVGEGREGRSMVPQSTGGCGIGEAPAAKVDKKSAPAVFGDEMEDAGAGEDTSAVEERWHDLPKARTQHSNTTVKDCKLPQGTAAETVASTTQSPALQGPPPRKKKRGATETSKRISGEVLPVVGVSTQGGDEVAAPSGAAATVPFTHPSSDDNTLQGKQPQRPGRSNSFLGASATTRRGRRRSRIGGNGRSGEEHTAQENNNIRPSGGSLNQSSECASEAQVEGSNVIQFAAQACPLLQVPGACFATPPYIMVPVTAATPLTATRRSSSGGTVPAAALHPVAAACGSTAGGKKSKQREKHKSASVAGASRQTSLVRGSHQDDEEAEQQWARRTSARMKDIAVGKATEGYKNFIRIVPKDKRRAGDPATPDPKQRCSKAKFQRELLDWRKQLHQYDGRYPPEEYGTLPDKSCSSGGAAAEWNIEFVCRTCSPPRVGDYRCNVNQCDMNSSCKGKNVVLQSSCGCSTSAFNPSPTPLFSTPNGSSEHGTRNAAAFTSHPDPIEQFNRECERTWL